MEKKVYIVYAVDPDDEDTFEIGYFLNKEEALKAKRRYEYTTDTGYAEARIDEEVISEKADDISMDSNMIGYYAFLKDEGAKNYILIRDKVAREEYHEYDDIIEELYDEYVDDIKAVQIDNIIYTEVEYKDTDEEMEVAAAANINEFLNNKIKNDKDVKYIINTMTSLYRNYNNLINEDSESEAFRQLNYVRGLGDALYQFTNIKCNEEFGGTNNDPILGFEGNLLSKVTFSKFGIPLEIINF